MRSAVQTFEVSVSPSFPHRERSVPPAPPPVPPPIRAPSDAELPRVATPVPLESSQRRTRVIALGVALLCSFLAVAHLVAPLWIGIAFGTVMAFTAQPLFRALCQRLGHRRKLAAILTTAITGVAWCAVGTAIVYTLTREAVSVGGVLKHKIDRGSLEGLVGPQIAHLVDTLGISRHALMVDLEKKASLAADDLGRAAGFFVQTTGAMVLGLVIGLMTMYYVLIEWVNLAVKLERVLPLDPRHTRLLLLEFRDVGRSAMVGSITTALIQGALGGAAYAVAGIPHAVTFALLTFVGSFLPAIGTGLVWIPLGVYLIVTGQLLSGVLLLAFCSVVVVGISDYVIRPRLVGKEEHPLLTLLALLGGLEVFGLPGLLVGPMLMALFVAILRIYEREQVEAAATRDKPVEVAEKL